MNRTEHTKSNDINIFMEDWNAKVATGKVGSYGLGTRNERGTGFVQFCQDNVWYKLLRRRLYTWRLPHEHIGDVARNKIDYITFNKTFCNCTNKT